MKHSVEYLKKITYRTRKRFLEVFTKLGYGHVTSAYSWAEIATVLYYEVMDFDNINSPIDDKHRIFVSKGHGCGILFPIFEDLGLLGNTKLEDVLLVGSSTNKLRENFYPGFDFYGGSLGVGLPLAVGLAMGNKLSDLKQKIYCIIGDAECYEGSIWEAIHFAGHNGLSNLLVIVDRNGLGCSDFTEHMLKLEPFADKWLASNWNVQEIDGYDFVEIYNAITKEYDNSKPTCIIANTKKGQGLDYTIDKPLMHGFMPNTPEQIEKAFKELHY